MTAKDKVMGKFNFKKVKGERIYKKWAEYEVGDYVVGKLTEVGEDQFKKANYIVEVIETSLEGVAEGKNLCLNSNGSLDYRMEDIEIGSVIRVEYTGQIEMEKGPFKGKMAHTVDLQVATDVEVREEDLPPAVEEDEEEDEDGL